MESEVYLQLRNIEDTHWWFVARRAIIGRILNSMALPRDCNILDVGCGTGGNLAMLKAFGEVVGLEMNQAAMNVARARNVCPVHWGVLPNIIPFQERQFDLVILLDVLEHVDDHLLVLKSIDKILKPGGRVVITVPAFQFLWSEHDNRHHHKRRYTKRELTQTLLESGLKPMQVTYYNTFLFPLISAVRIAKNILSIRDTDDVMPVAWLNKILYTIFVSECHLITRCISLPFGVSLLAVAQRSLIRD